MKQHFHLLFLLLIGALFSACRKEIMLDLENESNKVVIEAIITEGAGPHTVHLTRSVPFEASNTFPAISNATVILRDDQGNSEQLSEIAPGVYNTTALVGEPGRTYALSATVDGTTHTARSTMPAAVPMEMLLIDSIASFGTYMKIIVPVYSDPGAVADHYRFIIHVNGEKLDDINVVSDRFTNGNMVFEPLFLNDYELKTGDVVQVAMECIDPEVYHYFFSLMQNTMNAATPADPVSNLSNGALGYLTAQTSSTRTVVVP